VGNTRAQRFFVAGTDTGVGKTLVSAALLHAANVRGLRSIGLKPIAAGSEPTSDGVRNDDALLLQKTASVQLAYEQVNPIALAAPIAPHIAAEQEGRRISVDRLAGYCRGAMSTPHDVCIVEGAGGWRVPVNGREYLSALPKALNLPVVLVVGLRLGCLNHALLTAETVVRDGCQIAGWVANRVDQSMREQDQNLSALEQRFPFPLLGDIPFLTGAAPERAAECIDINKLLGAEVS